MSIFAFFAYLYEPPCNSGLLPQRFQLKPNIGIILVQLLRIILFTFKVLCWLLFYLIDVTYTIRIPITACRIQFGSYFIATCIFLYVAISVNKVFVLPLRATLQQSECWMGRAMPKSDILTTFSRVSRQFLAATSLQQQKVKIYRRGVRNFYRNKETLQN